MSDTLVALFIGAGIATFVYTKIGRRLGVENGAKIWLITGISFVFVFIFTLTLLKYVLHIDL